MRSSTRLETDTAFVVEYIVPMHGSIVVAFKDAVSFPGQEGIHKIGAIPVAFLLDIAKV